MSNFIEEAKKRSAERSTPRVRDVRAEIREMNKWWEDGRLLKKKIKEEFINALKSTGISATLEELARERNGSASDPYQGDVLYRTLVWEGEHSRHDIGSQDWEEEWDTFYLGVYYHEDGRLEFRSATGDVSCEEGSKNIKSQFLSKEQWSTNPDLVAETLEKAYKSPYIGHVKIDSFPHGDPPNNGWGSNNN